MANGAGGRPTLYNEKYCQEMIDFFDRDYKQKSHGKIEACDFPSVAGFARKIGVAKSSLYKWASEHPEFSAVLARCKDIQEDILINNSLKGAYNAAFSQFLLKNTHGFKDKQEVEQTVQTIQIDKDDERV